MCACEDSEAIRQERQKRSKREKYLNNSGRSRPTRQYARDASKYGTVEQEMSVTWDENELLGRTTCHL